MQTNYDDELDAGIPEPLDSPLPVAPAPFVAKAEEASDDEAPDIGGLNILSLSFCSSAVVFILCDVQRRSKPIEMTIRVVSTW